MKYLVDCRLISKGKNLTHGVIKIGTEKGQELAPEMASMIWENMRQSVENFKRFSEAGEN